VRAALKEYMECLPQPFVMLDIETRIKEKAPFVVVALQEVRKRSSPIRTCLVYARCRRLIHSMSSCKAALVVVWNETAG
jgi:hypothetical protein